MASLYPQHPQRSATQVWMGTVGALSAGLVGVSTPYGSSVSAMSTSTGYYHAGASALVVRAGGDHQRPMVLGQSGYSTP